MVGFSESLVDSEENFTEMDAESSMEQFQNRQNNLHERFISLKAFTETLRNQISNEKTLWQKELKETVDMEKRMRDKHKITAAKMALNKEEYKIKLDIFKEFLFFSQTSSNLQAILEKNNYQEWLSEIEIETNTELDKIKRSMAALKPLQKIVSTWVDDGDQNDQAKCDQEMQ